MREKNRALVVEGYFDCLVAHQHGFTETVAALGTAFTAPQLGVLRRYCDEVITFFDADAAGQKAAERAEELLEPTGQGLTWGVNRAGAFDSTGALRVKVALLPAGHDPDTFLRAEGAAAFAERIASARSLLAYALDRAIGEAGRGGPRDRVNAFARVALMLAKVGDAQEAAALGREAALKLGVDPTQLWIEAQRLQSALRKPTAVAGVATATPATSQYERDLVTVVLTSPAVRAALLPMIERADVTHAGLWAIVAALQQRPEAPAETLMSELEHPEGRGLLAALLVEERETGDPGPVIEQFRKRLERAHGLRRLRGVGQTLAEAQPQALEPTPLRETLTALHEEGAVVYQLGGGVAQTLERRVVQSAEPGPEGPQGVHPDE
jgi:DNA primase